MHDRELEIYTPEIYTTYKQTLKQVLSLIRCDNIKNVINNQMNIHTKNSFLLSAKI